MSYGRSVVGSETYVVTPLNLLSDAVVSVGSNKIATSCWEGREGGSPGACSGASLSQKSINWATRCKMS
jgi:hypothetical protein